MDFDKFTLLSHILLRKIFYHLETIDQISCSLVCKRWFNDRDHLYRFKRIPYIDGSNLKSYQLLISRAEDSKNNYELDNEYDDKFGSDSLLMAIKSIMTLEEFGEIKYGVKNIVLSGYDREIKLGAIPESCTSLNLGGGFVAPLTEGVLPQSLKSLCLGTQEPGKLSAVSIPTAGIRTVPSVAIAEFQ
ncbi:hypothetical protein PPL_05057 [Heterostelium album PN500]|uniref:F-box domain-containing protein n=1 Tax=Heterostelium pallidum (strain ATCC 26659 / Pp 5 / PN500) TaxID=670386 RepID=D3B9B3_HETP5|nr:hypothetical protein PPL_05057 [Heterostelium album PN500]EFA81825.1 hypothetical protein PPL_05057 [Heterostelium album PN500]|eukprot:XP_020433942.1 hypothetical protein PPL_05057 [Heterostelium album PN500]